MKTLLKIIICALFLSFIATSCKTTEYIYEEKTIYDTIQIEKTITDTIIQEKEIDKIRDIKTKVFLPCPKGGDKGGKGRNESGDNYTEWEYDEDKGGYNVELYCAEQINQKDSIIRKLTKEIGTYKSSSKETISEKEKVTEKSSWWQSLFKNVWKVLFFTVLLLWLFGITPKWILKRLF